MSHRLRLLTLRVVRQDVSLNRRQVVDDKVLISIQRRCPVQAGTRPAIQRVLDRQHQVARRPRLAHDRQHSPGNRLTHQDRALRRRIGDNGHAALLDLVQVLRWRGAVLQPQIQDHQHPTVGPLHIMQAGIPAH